MAKSEKGGGNNLTRQHYQVAIGNRVKVGGGKTPIYSKGAKVAPKRGRG